MIRISGERAEQIFTRCFARKAKGPLRSHRLCYGHVVDEEGSHLDEAMGVFMRAPGTYTREDLCELHVHGGDASARRALARVLRAGARLAEPGEFTKRAFLNGRIDLSEAEAVMALISSGSESAARAALRQLEGGLSRFVTEQIEQLTNLLALIEAGNDFPEEIDEQATSGQVIDGARQVRRALEKAADEKNARLIREGLSVVLVGKPNVGKSSLLNALIKQERAIVTAAPGTTRDVLTERIRLNGLLIEISDTAGRRQARDEAEQIGIARAEQAQKAADVVLLVLDASSPLEAQDQQLLSQADGRVLVVLNKKDLVSSKCESLENQLPRGSKALCVCATTGDGIDELLSAIAERFAGAGAIEQQMTTERHIGCAQRAITSLGSAIETLAAGSPVDLAAIDLMAALGCLTEITGASASERVIDGIFEKFCVGK